MDAKGTQKTTPDHFEALKQLFSNSIKRTKCQRFGSLSLSEDDQSIRSDDDQSASADLSVIPEVSIIEDKELNKLLNALWSHPTDNIFADLNPDVSLLFTASFSSSGRTACSRQEPSLLQSPDSTNRTPNCQGQSQAYWSEVTLRLPDGQKQSPADIIRSFFQTLQDLFNDYASHVSSKNPPDGLEARFEGAISKLEKAFNGYCDHLGPKNTPHSIFIGFSANSPKSPTHPNTPTDTPASKKNSGENPSEGMGHRPDIHSYSPVPFPQASGQNLSSALPPEAKHKNITDSKKPRPDIQPGSDPAQLTRDYRRQISGSPTGNTKGTPPASSASVHYGWICALLMAFVLGLEPCWAMWLVYQFDLTLPWLMAPWCMATCMVVSLCITMMCRIWMPKSAKATAGAVPTVPSSGIVQQGGASHHKPGLSACPHTNDLAASTKNNK